MKTGNFLLLGVLFLVCVGRNVITAQDEEILDEEDHSLVQYGCDCEGNPHCLVGGRLYWSHEGIDAFLKTWVQASFVPESAGGGPTPESLEIECTGTFFSNGISEEMTKTFKIASDLIQGRLIELPVVEFDPSVTPIGDVERIWGSGVLQDVEVGTWIQCCWSGEARFTPLENADDCTNYNLCYDADLRATNEGPKPRGSGTNSGTIDRLWRDGFVVASVCKETSIDLEAVDETAGGDAPTFWIDDTGRPGTNEVPNIQDVKPTVSDTGFFEWRLDQVDTTQGGVDGVFSVNVEVRERETSGILMLNGTMDIDFVVAVDPTRPVCWFEGIEGEYGFGDPIRGTAFADDISETGIWRSNEDLIDITRARSSTVDFDTNPTLPIQDQSTAEGAVEIPVNARCTGDGTFTIGLRVTDTCGHTAECSVDFFCISPPTEAPTAAPTASPTAAPTAAPTDAPTAAPTAAPTDAPTAAPTDAPTEHPTSHPTDAPTDAPTDPPTEHPTAAPTTAPTDAPTDSPTQPPTEPPTDPPTDRPTSPPTDAPTWYPTDPPTEAPTNAPTDFPTDSPTEKPIKAGCDSFVDGDVFFLADDHWVVPVGWVFEADFTFKNRPPYQIHNMNQAPGAWEDPEIPRIIDTEDHTVNAFYNCTSQTSPSGSADDGEYLKLEYGFEKPVSGYCDTAFECCDVGCEFVYDNNTPECGEEFTARIDIHACADARVRIEELPENGASRADIVNQARTWKDGDEVTVTFQCPNFRSDETTISVKVIDQYGGEDTCEMTLECDHCLKTCDCPMCAPMDKAWVCYIDGEGDIALHAFTKQEIADNEETIFYPTETYKTVPFDCFCEPVMDFPSSGMVYMCHYDFRTQSWKLTSVQEESRPGPLNDMEDYLNAGDGFPGHYNTDPFSTEWIFLDLWCGIAE